MEILKAKINRQGAKDTKAEDGGQTAEAGKLHERLSHLLTSRSSRDKWNIQHSTQFNRQGAKDTKAAIQRLKAEGRETGSREGREGGEGLP